MPLTVSGILTVGAQLTGLFGLRGLGYAALLEEVIHHGWALISKSLPPTSSFSISFFHLSLCHLRFLPYPPADKLPTHGAVLSPGILSPRKLLFRYVVLSVALYQSNAKVTNTGCFRTATQLSHFLPTFIGSGKNPGMHRTNLIVDSTGKVNLSRLRFAKFCIRSNF